MRIPHQIEKTQPTMLAANIINPKPCTLHPHGLSPYIQPPNPGKVPGGGMRGSQREREREGKRKGERDRERTSERL